ncbi:MAG: HIT family protein [Desulfobacterales bacterium]|nr:HIT family protein [Deltaproteobacteria bacterium]NNK97345.1 HIT family protein [Desulfobacterales bacterium]
MIDNNRDNQACAEQQTDCPFCYDNAKENLVEEYQSVFAIEDGYPVSDGHLLIIPKRHSGDYFTMIESERRDADHLIEIVRKKVQENDPTISGFNIGMNCGESAGQSVFHCHIHLIPRRYGDTPKPKGGVRGVIPDKMGY